ncbi:kinase-like (PK-like) [Fusarium acutatum]|uniref:Kinase-like (PK-like) n=1 Tax=Fusarium acutatum TaxID=78861 RepID=A0A8H4NBV3_9HYPO|nr:kinase-like (PK-like) [Fusarium acutatum]
MSGLKTAVAAINVAEMTLKVLKIGVTITSDARNYGKDARTLGLKFQQLTHRYDSLQKILFQVDKFAFLHRKNLFSQLPEETCKVIRQLFLELLQVLYVHFALEQQYAKTAEESPTNVKKEGSTHLGLTSGEQRLIFANFNIDNQGLPAPHRSSSLLSLSSWRWALHGKKRAARINSEFEDWLKCIRETLEDFWWPLPFLNNIPNLDALTTDADARQIGTAQTAVLRKLLLSDIISADDPVTDWNAVKDVTAIAGKAVGVLSNKRVLVETLSFPLDEDGQFTDLLHKRFSKIVQLLKAQQDPDFRVLRGLKYASKIDESKRELRLISHFPITSPLHVKTLRQLYRDVVLTQRPSLGFRFKLCSQLAESVYLLHSVDWVHHALRSDNVLVLLPSHTLSRESLQASELRICGFEAARPETDTSIGPYDNAIARNVYRHPERWGTPREMFRQSHDVYGERLLLLPSSVTKSLKRHCFANLAILLALGVVLLEIGLWEAAEDLISRLRDSQRTPKHVKAFLRRQVDERLVHQCGDIFATAVRRCLKWHFDVEVPSYASDQLRIHRGLAEQVVNPLRSLKEAV